MKKPILRLLVLILSLTTNNTYAQTCECTDCPVAILDLQIVTSVLEVSGLTNNTLNSGGQGICEVSLNYEHEFLPDLEITLIAPDGSSILLLPDGFGGSTLNSTWDITFLPCTDPVFPDPGAGDQYDSDDFNSFTDYIGSYYPGDGCFSDFTGSANGSWTLQFDDNNGGDFGELFNWSITFCDGDGLDCFAFTCEAAMGDFSIETVTFCDTDDPIEAAPDVTGGNTDADYTTTWVLALNDGGPTGEIIGYSETADFTGYPPDVYYICGLNYLTSDESLLPAPNAGNTPDDITDLINAGTICADYGFACLNVEIENCGCAAEAGFFVPSQDLFCETDIIDLMVEVTDENQDSDYGYNFPVFNDESGSIGTLIEYSEDAILSGYTAGQYWVCGLSYLLSDESLLTPVNGSNTEVDIIDDINNEVFCGDFDNHCYLIAIEEEVELPTLDFEAEVCVGQASEITVLNYDPDAIYNITVNSGSFSMLFTGVPTTEFIPQSDIDIEICFTILSTCGDLQSCANITVNESSTDDLMIEGPDELCPDNFINYTLTGLDANTIVGWTISGDASIVGSTTNDNVNVQIDNVSTTGSAELCIEVEDDCGENVEVCLDINVVDNELTNNTESNFCTLDFDVSVLIDGGDGVGVWTVVTAPVGIVAFDNLNNSTTGVSVTFPFVDVADFVLQFTYQCNQTIEVAFTVTEPIETENVEVECSGDMYTVSFDIIGGLAPYSVNGAEITGNNYTSDLMNDDPYSFTISDDSDCDDLILTGNSECECESNAGTINPQDLLVSCENETVTATSNGDAFLEDDDIGIWILYSDLSDPLGSIIIENNTGNFSFVAPLDYMITYFIAYVVGNDISGTVDLIDPCLDIADGTSIIFSEPFGLTGITVDPLNSCGSEFELTADQDSPIAGNWSITTIPTGGNGSLSNINGLSTTVTLEGIGDFEITYSTADGLCSVTTDVIISGPELPEATLVNIECSDDNSTYSITIDASGGTAPYFVNSVELTGNTFFSPSITSGDSYDYVIVDANGCESESVTGTFLCNCDSFAGTMPSDDTEICGDDLFTTANNGDETLDGNDALIYILHTNSNTTIGTILDQNGTGAFSFLPTMVYGTTYYISAVVGNADGSSVDFIDECLSVASGQAITWYEEIIINNITSDPEMGCDVFNLTVNSNFLEEGTWTTISSPTGSLVTLSSNTALSTIATVDIPGTYTLQYEQNNGPCLASNEVSFILSTPPVISNISYECDDANENYTVSFDISGGQQPYTVNGNASGATFTSAPSPNGISVDYIVSDVNDCEAQTFTANFSCDVGCISSVGTMPGDTLKSCYDTIGIQPIIQVFNNGDFILDGDDAGVYILHFPFDINFTAPFAQSGTGTFQDLGIVPYNQVLHITYVVGNELDGSVDLLDPCLSVSNSQPIIFYQDPRVFLGVDRAYCGLEVEKLYSINTGGENIEKTWNTLSTPMGESINIDDSNAPTLILTASAPGAYSISLTIATDQCATTDTLNIEFLGDVFVNVMDDFSTCISDINLTSTTDASQGIWSIPELPNVVFDFLSNNTSVILDTFGTFDIIRTVTEDICTATDTVTVEIFPPSEFLITEIICDGDNENYTINYEIEGDSYPYTINGDEILEGETILLTAPSGSDLEVIIVDNNQCEIINTVFNESCECQSQLEDNAQDLIRACIQDTMFIPPVQNFTLGDGDSLVYVMHSPPIEEITDIIAVSGDPFFTFDASNMSTIFPYFVTAVIYNGGEFSLNSLNSICTQTDLSRPVFWYGPSETFIEDQTLTFCEGTDVVVPINHIGQVPIFVGISNTNGADFQIEITEEGITEVVVPMDGSGFVSIGYIVPLFFCDNTFEGVATINITSNPTLDLVDDFEVCDNISEGNTLVTLNDLINNNSVEGLWTDQNGISVDGTLDFDGFDIGDYVFTYTIEDNICEDLIDSTIISVTDCIDVGCPTEVTLPLPEVCEGGSVVNLNDYVLPEYVDIGFWTLVEGGVSIVVEIPDITISAQATGQAEFFYTLPGLDDDCDSIFFDVIIINESLNSGESINDVYQYCESDFQEILLFDLIENYDLGGIWSSNDTGLFSESTGGLNLADLTIGSYQFDYTVGQEIESCPISTTSVFIEINQSESVILNAIDPLCFGIDNGSVSITDVNGNLFTNPYQIIDSESEIITDESMLAPGAYNFVGTGQNGCEILSGFIINDPLETFLDLGIDIIIEEGETATISSSTNILDQDISLYQWIVNQSNIDAPTYENLILNPTGESLVQLTIIDEDGCIVSDDILISVIITEQPEVEVILPNIFNANNSSFGVEPFSKIESVKAFLIYDRWGNNVFLAEDYDPRNSNMLWNGDYKGDQAMSGVYVYYISYIDVIGEVQIISGDVTLIR